MPVFTANIPGPLKVGDRIEIAGKIKENARKMSVNLCAEEGEEPLDVVLHYDVRFHRDNIISLSRKNGTWIGSGNYDTNYNMFVPGTHFRIVFEIKDTDVITIYCQGKFHSNFLPKIPLSLARFVVAWADIERVTHCFFYMQGQPSGAQDGANLPPPPVGVIPTHTQSPPVLNADVKRSLARQQRKKMCMNECPRLQHSSSDSSVEQEGLPQMQPKTKNQEDIVAGRADKFFYESLMTNPNPKYYKMSPPKNQIHVNKDGSPNAYISAKRPEYSYGSDETGKFNGHESTDESEDTLVNYGDDVSQVSKGSSGVESSNVSRDMSPNKGSLYRRARMPFAHVCNFMTKTKRNKRHIL